MKERKKVTDFFRRKMNDRFIPADREGELSDTEVRLSDERDKEFIQRTLIGITAAGGNSL